MSSPDTLIFEPTGGKLDPVAVLAPNPDTGKQECIGELVCEYMSGRIIVPAGSADDERIWVPDWPLIMRVDSDLAEDDLDEAKKKVREQWAKTRLYEIEWVREGAAGKKPAGRHKRTIRAMKNSPQWALDALGIELTSTWILDDPGDAPASHDIYRVREGEKRWWISAGTEKIIYGGDTREPGKLAFGSPDATDPFRTPVPVSGRCPETGEMRVLGNLERVMKRDYMEDFTEYAWRLDKKLRHHFDLIFGEDRIGDIEGLKKELQEAWQNKSADYIVEWVRDGATGGAPLENQRKRWAFRALNPENASTCSMMPYELCGGLHGTDPLSVDLQTDEEDTRPTNRDLYRITSGGKSWWTTLSTYEHINVPPTTFRFCRMVVADSNRQHYEHYDFDYDRACKPVTAEYEYKHVWRLESAAQRWVEENDKDKDTTYYLEVVRHPGDSAESGILKVKDGYVATVY